MHDIARYYVVIDLVFLNCYLKSHDNMPVAIIFLFISHPLTINMHAHCSL